MLFKRIGLKIRLYLTLGGLMFFIFLAGEWNLWQSSEINKRVDNIYTQEVIPLENISNLKGAIYRMRDRSLRLIDTKDPIKIKHHKSIIEKQVKRINHELDNYDNTRLSKEEQFELENFKINFKEYFLIIINKIYPNLITNSEIDLEEILYKEAIFEFRQAREALNRLSEYQIQRAKLRYKNSNEILKNQTIIIQFLLLFILSISGLFARKLIKSIMEPIEEINNVLNKISHKDFSNSIRIQSQDEFGKMSQMLNSNIKTLQNTFQELSTLVYYDGLTKLANRTMFQDEIDKCIDDCSNTNKLFAVMFIDIDNFKNVNDLYGHTVGDELLKIIGKIMKNNMRESDTLARLGGDEFAILVQDIKNQTVPGNIANQILDLLQKPIYIDLNTIFCSVSIGIYVSSNEHESKEKILSYADIAMYAAKNSGKAKYKYFNKSMHEKMKNEILLENDLRDAIKNDEFKIYYQPIIEPETELLYGIEALLRWQKGEELISPIKFIPILESNGMIVDVTYMIIEKVFEMVERRNFKSIVSINLSILQFYDNDFIPFLKRMLQQHKEINPEKIYFEITESVFAQNNDLIFSTMELIKRLGFKFSLDDFGTGYSSLSYIKDYPINTLKIDKTFVDNLLEDSKSQELLGGIICLANTLHLTIIIEGVENLATINALKKYNNLKIQGYYFFKPMPQKEFEQLLD